MPEIQPFPLFWEFPRTGRPNGCLRGVSRLGRGCGPVLAGFSADGGSLDFDPAPWEAWKVGNFVSGTGRWPVSPFCSFPHRLAAGATSSETGCCVLVLFSRAWAQRGNDAIQLLRQHDSWHHRSWPSDRRRQYASVAARSSCHVRAAPHVAPCRLARAQAHAGGNDARPGDVSELFGTSPPAPPALDAGRRRRPRLSRRTLIGRPLTRTAHL